MHLLDLLSLEVGELGLPELLLDLIESWLHETFDTAVPTMSPPLFIGVPPFG